jgi:hypothetical protein
LCLPLTTRSSIVCDLPENSIEHLIIGNRVELTIRELQPGDELCQPMLKRACFYQFAQRYLLALLQSAARMACQCLPVDDYLREQATRVSVVTAAFKYITVDLWFHNRNM